MLLRQATLDDARAIAAVHVRSWQGAYKGVVPSAVLNALSVEERARAWRQNLERRSSETWVAERNGQVVGWISAGRSRDADSTPATGEVWAIYVDPAFWRGGAGRGLWREAENYLIESGFSEVTVWVLKANGPAIAFYEASGLAIDSGVEQTVRLGGVELPEIRLRKRVGG